jgi:hypothetical protein
LLYFYSGRESSCATSPSAEVVSPSRFSSPLHLVPLAEMASKLVHPPPSSSSSAIEREREAQHRAELAALVSRVVPRPRPAVDLLLALARPSAASESYLTPLRVGHNERNIDFWDERKLKDYLKRSDSESHDKLELKREQVDAVKATHKAFADACKRTAKGFDVAEPERIGEAGARLSS